MFPKSLIFVLLTFVTQVSLLLKSLILCFGYCSHAQACFLSLYLKKEFFSASLWFILWLSSPYRSLLLKSFDLRLLSKRSKSITFIFDLSVLNFRFFFSWERKRGKVCKMRVCCFLQKGFLLKSFDIYFEEFKCVSS